MHLVPRFLFLLRKPKGMLAQPPVQEWRFFTGSNKLCWRICPNWDNTRLEQRMRTMDGLTRPPVRPSLPGCISMRRSPLAHLCLTKLRNMPKESWMENTEFMNWMIHGSCNLITIMTSPNPLFGHFHVRKINFEE